MRTSAHFVAMTEAGDLWKLNWLSGEVQSGHLGNVVGGPTPTTGHSASGLKSQYGADN